MNRYNRRSMRTERYAYEEKWRRQRNLAWLITGLFLFGLYVGSWFV